MVYISVHLKFSILLKCWSKDLYWTFYRLPFFYCVVCIVQEKYLKQIFIVSLEVVEQSPHQKKRKTTASVCVLLTFDMLLHILYSFFFFFSIILVENILWEKRRNSLFLFFLKIVMPLLYNIFFLALTNFSQSCRQRRR